MCVCDGKHCCECVILTETGKRCVCVWWSFNTLKWKHEEEEEEEEERRRKEEEEQEEEEILMQ